jgi:hypothetical protein
LVWTLTGEPEMYVSETEPAKVDAVNEKNVYLEMKGCGGEFMVKIERNKYVLKAPKDWYEKEKKYTSDEYWLEQADKLGI